MDEKDIALNNLIFKTKVGSKLYGTDTPDSDDDYVGVFIAPKEYYLGLKNIEEVDLSTVSKDSSGKNTKEAIDFKVYELRKFIKLALDCNPNIIELLFAENELDNPIWDRIIQHREYFLDSELIRKKFKGYAFSQKRKMIVKLENFDIIREAYNMIVDSDALELRDVKGFEKFEVVKNLQRVNDIGKVDRKGLRSEYFVGDIFIQKRASVKKAKEILQTRLGRVGNRQELILKHGFDTKFSSHVARLLLECEELLTTEHLNFPLKYSEAIKDIKTGKYTTAQEVYNLATEIEYRIDNIDVKFKRNYNKIDNLLIDIVGEYIKLKI